MTQSDFNVAFQAAAAGSLPAAPHEPRAIAAEILRRDRWRTRTFAVLSLLFWLLGTAGMMLLIYGLNRFVIFVRIGDLPAIASMQEPATTTTSDATTCPTTQPAMIIPPRDAMRMWGTSLLHHSMPYIAGSVVSIMLAALFTVLLIFSSRQATLNRINLSLMQICKQLKAGGGNP